jgi:cytochrome c nitrite reductase small subunit
VSGKLPVVLAVLLGLLFGLGVYTFQFAKGLSYFSNAPENCANCHIMQDHLESWEKSSHHTRATCNDCHTPHNIVQKFITKADNGWNHSVKFTLQNFGDPIRIRPVNAEKLQENCVRCHFDITGDIRTETAVGHGSELLCVRCHAGVGHGPRR